MKYIEAIRNALRRVMQEDESIIVLGEDVAVDGGVFRATDGLWNTFGNERVIDTPLAEAGITGLTIGLATQGIKPIAEIQFMGFAYSCLDQLANHASRLRNRTRGRLNCPLVLRIPYGGGIRAPEHHSESVESMFAHIPGLKVVVPSSPIKAYSTILSAAESSDPVVILEPKKLYQSEEDFDETSVTPLPLDHADLVQPGSDITLLAWGAMLPPCLAAAEALKKRDVYVEVIDVACLSVLDMSTIEGSVKRTGRCVVVHEAARSAGFGAELSARLAEDSILNLRAPIKRVTGFDTVMPLARLETYYLPNSTRIIDACLEVMEYE